MNNKRQEKLDRLNETKYSDYLLDKISNIGGYDKLSPEEKNWLNDFYKNKVRDFHVEDLDDNKPELGYDKLGHLTVDGKPIAEYQKEQEKIDKKKEIGLPLDNRKNDVRIFKNFGDKIKYFYAHVGADGSKIVCRMLPDVKKNSLKFMKTNIYDGLSKDHFFDKLDKKYDYYIKLNDKDGTKFVHMISLMRNKGDIKEIDTLLTYFNNLI